MAFSASWDRKRMASNQALLGTVPDARHAVVHDHDTEYSDNPVPDSWMSTIEDPGTVGQLLGEQTIYADQIGDGGPVDHTPIDHTTGDGVGAALSDRDAQEQNAQWRQVDYNATAARRWARPVDVDYDNVAERLSEADPIGELGSMATVDLHVGTNKASYPNTRPGARIHRWRDRVMARHPFTTDHRPLYVPNAYASVPRPAGDSYLVSPYPSHGHVNVIMEKAPQLRRAPEPWGNAVITDGSTGPADPALDVWGQ
jgi:hypothetical protein